MTKGIPIIIKQENISTRECVFMCEIHAGLHDGHMGERVQKSREKSKTHEVNVPQWGTLFFPYATIFYSQKL